MAAFSSSLSRMSSGICSQCTQEMRKSTLTLALQPSGQHLIPVVVKTAWAAPCDPRQVILQWRPQQTSRVPIVRLYCTPNLQPSARSLCSRVKLGARNSETYFRNSVARRQAETAINVAFRGAVTKHLALINSFLSSRPQASVARRSGKATKTAVTTFTETTVTP